MQRRTFNRAIASLLMVPLLKMRPEAIDRHKLLAMFLDTEVYRYDLSRPYVFGDFAYATDGRTMARITSSEDEADDETIRRPPCDKAWERLHHPETQWKPFRLHDIADLYPGQDATCPLCFGRRVSYGPNYPNDNETAENLPQYDPDDNTIADVSCELCYGRIYSGPAFQQVDSVIIDYRYAKRLSEIPGCEVCVGVGALVPPSLTHVLFRSEVGIGGIVGGIVKS